MTVAKVRAVVSAADPDPGSGALLPTAPGSRISDPKHD
jgi:hypothetical protein